MVMSRDFDERVKAPVEILSTSNFVTFLILFKLTPPDISIKGFLLRTACYVLYINFTALLSVLKFILSSKIMSDFNLSTSF